MLDQRPLQYVVHALVQTRLVGVFGPRSEVAEETYGLPNGLVHLFVGQGVEDAVAAQQHVIKVESDTECSDFRFGCHDVRSTSEIAGFALDVAECPGNLTSTDFYRQTSGFDSPGTKDPLVRFLWDSVDLGEIRVCRCVVNLCLHGNLVVADSVQLATILEDALHLPKELGFMVVGTDGKLLSPLARQYCSGVADIHEQQLVVWITEAYQQPIEREHRIRWCRRSGHPQLASRTRRPDRDTLG